MKKKPTLTWEDVTIGQYLKMQDIIASKDIAEENKVLEIIPLFFDIDVENEPMGNVLVLMEVIANLINTEIKPGKLQKKYEVGKWSAKVTGIDTMTIS